MTAVTTTQFPRKLKSKPVTGYFKSVEALATWIGFESSRWKSEGKGVGVIWVLVTSSKAHSFSTKIT